VHIARATSYTIEDILSHDLDWVREIMIEITKQEFEENLTQLAIHGVTKKNIDDARKRFRDQLRRSNSEESASPALGEFSSKGISIGRPTGTRIIR
jgi:hypothetical protein